MKNIDCPQSHCAFNTPSIKLCSFKGVCNLKRVGDPWYREGSALAWDYSEKVVRNVKGSHGRLMDVMIALEKFMLTGEKDAGLWATIKDYRP